MRQVHRTITKGGNNLSDYKVIQELAVFGKTRKGEKRLRVVSSGNGLIEFDLRRFKHTESGLKPSRGISFTWEEAVQISRAIQEYLNGAAGML